MALFDNGSNEEIMLSHKSVQQSIENGAKKYEQTAEIDDCLSGYSDEELSNMFFDEIKAIKEGKPGNIFTFQFVHDLNREKLPQARAGGIAGPAQKLFPTRIKDFKRNDSHC